MMERSSSSSSGRIDRKTSIENEPRTLRIDQIQNAREAALYVMSTRSIEEAMSIFTEGLETVESVTMQNEGSGELGEELQCLEDQLQVPLLREVATAPF